MPRRHHGEPRQRIRIFAGSQRIVRPFKPIARIFKLAGKFLHDLGANLVTAASDPRADGGDNFLRARAEKHAHAADGFFSDAFQGAAPAGMNRGDDAVVGVGQQNGNAIGGLHGDEQSGSRGDERVALQNVRRHDFDNVNDVGMNLAESDELHGLRAERFLKEAAVFFHARAFVPIAEAQVQDGLGRFRSRVGILEAACATWTCAEPVHQPFFARERWGLQNSDAGSTALRPSAGIGATAGAIGAIASFDRNVATSCAALLCG